MRRHQVYANWQFKIIVERMFKRRQTHTPQRGHELSYEVSSEMWRRKHRKISIWDTSDDKLANARDFPDGVAGIREKNLFVGDVIQVTQPWDVDMGEDAYVTESWKHCLVCCRHYDEVEDGLEIFPDDVFRIVMAYLKIEGEWAVVCNLWRHMEGISVMNNCLAVPHREIYTQVHRNRFLKGMNAGLK